MKSTVDTTPSERPFPKLIANDGAATGRSIIILAEMDKGKVAGTVVWTNKPSAFPIGYHSTDWNRAIMVDFDGTVTLSN